MYVEIYHQAFFLRTLQSFPTAMSEKVYAIARVVISILNSPFRTVGFLLEDYFAKKSAWEEEWARRRSHAITSGTFQYNCYCRLQSTLTKYSRSVTKVHGISGIITVVQKALAITEPRGSQASSLQAWSHQSDGEKGSDPQNCNTKRTNLAIMIWS